MRTQPEDNAASEDEDHSANSVPEPEEAGMRALQVDNRPRLHVVESASRAASAVATETVNSPNAVPQIQVEAWHWALNNCQEDGSLPTGREIAARFDHKERWGRLIKQWGQQGHFDGVSA